MDAWVWILIAVIVIAAAVAFWVARRRQEAQLRDRFGPEYDRAVSEHGGSLRAQSELRAREKRRAELEIVALDPEAREGYSAAWREVQSRFVDAPSESVGRADELVRRVMEERGYPMDSFEQREADISVDHPDVVQDYRAAHAISLANDHREASTEDLRQAMVHYRSLFEDLLETERGGTSEAR